MRNTIIALFVAALVAAALLVMTCQASADEPRPRGPLDPRGKVHVPIGIANSVDALKTFVEAEGCFSPGVATYGIYFWIWDGEKLIAPTQDGVANEHGLPSSGYLIPWTAWTVGDVSVKTEVCQVERDSPAGKVQVVGSLVTFDNRSNSRKQVTLFAAVRPLGPAGGRIKEIQVGPGGRSIFVDGHPALVARHPVNAAGVVAADTVGDFASRGDVPRGSSATSEAGDASGVLRLDVTLNPRQYAPYEFVCPVLPGRRAVGHKWDGKDPWAQLDDAIPFSAEGLLQPDPGLESTRRSTSMTSSQRRANTGKTSSAAPPSASPIVAGARPSPRSPATSRCA